MCSENTKVTLVEKPFGIFLDNKTGKAHKVNEFTWTNENKIAVKVITYGATITTIRMPDKNGVIDDIVLGFDDMTGYQNKLNPYFGATVGRVANRIGNSCFQIDGVKYKVSNNLGKHQLHGGFRAFDKVNWDYKILSKKVILSHISPDEDEGFPGNVIVNLTYELTDNNEFLINFMATTTKPTFINLTNHSYFNLGGHEKGANELYKHTICINADYTTDVDSDFISTGKLLPVAQTIFDLRVPKILGDVIHKVPRVGGYDHNYCVNKGSEQDNAFIARVTHATSGRVLEIYSDQPGVQFYTSNSIPEKSSGNKGKVDKLIGKGGAEYNKHGALCLETQNYPDAINHVNFPKAVTYPGEIYKHSITYKFFY